MVVRLLNRIDTVKSELKSATAVIAGDRTTKQ
jgi:hypothetical protein